MDHSLLIAQVEHGPQLHGGLLVPVLLAIAFAGGLVYLVVKRRSGSDREAQGDRSANEGDRSGER